jgi:Fur family peroxide stress response transcriptional regulator
LVRAGLVREVAVEGRAARFDAKGRQHHHFICERCGNVEDMEWYDVPKPASGSMGKRVLRECELIFRGLCTNCGGSPVKVSWSLDYGRMARVRKRERRRLHGWEKLYW